MDNRRVATVEETDSREKKGGRGCGCWILLLLVLLGGGGATAGLLGITALRQETPLPGEAQMANLMKQNLMVPSEFSDMRMPSAYVDPKDPSKLRPEAVAKGSELFQTQCSLCHGQKADGQGFIGKTQYPQANNLHSSDTQSKSPGQLYWLIAHGINFTGMPAWGTKYGGPNSDDEIWSMVAFVRSLGGQQ
ncbi:MAG TPA: cytochrome c [Chloroflexia bacterium]|nr:cytochrome c [Chloroflexia bacterium]